MDEIFPKCDCIQGTTLTGNRETKLLTFAPDKLPGIENFSEHETVYDRGKSELNKILF